MPWIFTIHTSKLLYKYVLLQILVAGLSRTEERLDSENQVRVEGLSDKVSRLKSVSQVLGLRLTDKVCTYRLGVVLKTVMVNNSTNINKTSNHLLPSPTAKKGTMT